MSHKKAVKKPVCDQDFFQQRELSRIIIPNSSFPSPIKTYRRAGRKHARIQKTPPKSLAYSPLLWQVKAPPKVWFL